MVSRWRLSESKFTQVSNTLLSILADRNNAIVSTVSIRPLISKSSSRFANHLMTGPSATITIGVTVNFMYYYFSVL